MASEQPAKRKDPVRIVCEAAVALSVMAACAAIFAQVIYRYVLDDPVSWLDEFAVFMFAWIIMLGAGVVQAEDAHMQVETLARSVGRNSQLVLYIIRFLGMGSMIVLLGYYGWFLTTHMWFVEYPAMEISRGWLFVVLPVSMPFLFYFLVRNAIRAMRVYRNGGKVFDSTHSEDVL
jgi:TRAP-type C4-dicarboxylate transport system permease small subunit